MVNWLRLGVPVAVLVAALYQAFFKNILSVLGVGRHVQPISDFPYTCRRIYDERLQACEDIWLSERTRTLYLACTDPLARRQWLPNIGHLNASGRSLSDAVIAMDIDKPSGDSYKYHVLSTPGLLGINGDQTMNLLGLDGLDRADGTHLFLVNNRPSLDPVTGDLLDNTLTGANSTIEHFKVSHQTHQLTHLRTFASPYISTPNNIAAVDNPIAIFFTNDHGHHKTGLQYELSPLLASGTLDLCDTSRASCEPIASGLRFPNGLIHGRDNRLYVPSTATGGIHVFSKTLGHGWKQTAFVPIPYPIDNLSQDRNGDIWIPAFPQLLEARKPFTDPAARTAAATILKLRRNAGSEGAGERAGQPEWSWEKVLEDAEGEVLPSATAVVHDARTGRLFVSGVLAPFITVCEKL